MLLYKQSESTGVRAKFVFVCVDDADGKTDEPGLTFSGSEVAVRKVGGTYAALTNIGSIVDKGDGEYEGEFTSAELNTLGPITVKIEKAGVRKTILLVGQVVPWDPYASQLPANVTHWKGTELAAPSSAGGLALPIVDTQMWDGTLVATPTTAGVPRVDVKAMEANVITATAIATDAIAAAKVAADAVTKIAAGLLATVIEAGAVSTARTVKQRLNIMFSILAGKAPDDLNASPYYFRNNPGGTDTKDRAAFTMSSGVRTPTTLDGDE